ncbi:MAG: hypothetical protein F4099_00765 [Synechococcus sp. SB0673_bin_10]|nr:hypothetical protein [Synechococcus sp. SB0667_bin_8]MYI71059.1 hypothetical protein [Synechococcus sp. SB0673_bin_10]
MLQHHSSTGEVAVLPLAQIEAAPAAGAGTDHGSLAGHAPRKVGPINRGAVRPLVEAGRRATGFDSSGIQQHLLGLCVI